VGGGSRSHAPVTSPSSNPATPPCWPGAHTVRRRIPTVRPGHLYRPPTGAHPVPSEAVPW